MKSFQKTYKINAPAEKVFEALTSAKHIADWSGAPATMNAKKGAPFSLWGGSIHGINLEVSPSKIVQHWKESKWEDFSTVTFHISEEKEITIINLVHEGIPDTSFANIKKGWDTYYMKPLVASVE